MKKVVIVWAENSNDVLEKYKNSNGKIEQKKKTKPCILKQRKAKWTFRNYVD